MVDLLARTKKKISTLLNKKPDTVFTCIGFLVLFLLIKTELLMLVRFD